MAVFGVPQLHEDDALRAVRAAVDLRDGIQGLGLDARIGVNSGDVITAPGDALVTGDAVNVAARLEQAAAPGEILLGETTQRLCGSAVGAQALEPLALKGKVDAVHAFRLVRLLPHTPGFDVPLVGRSSELSRVHACLETAVRERSGFIVTVVGSPGIGKSRLAREFLADLDGARALVGRCLPYGDGITYWPLVEIFREAGAEDELAAALSAGAPEEIALSVRRWLEGHARERPLILVIEDVNWAEPTFLDLIEYLMDSIRDVPLLVVCLARPEFLADRPGWADGRPNAATVTLEPLSEDESEELIEALLRGSMLDASLRARVRDAAGGNPLFVEQLLAMIAEGGDPAHVPPTIRALMSARLDALPAAERDLVERAAIIGLDFAPAALGALAADGDGRSEELLAALVRKELMRPDEARAGRFWFRHVLIRDAAYERLLKRRRAELHERFGEYLERQDDVPQRDELVGYHLEQAYLAEAALDPVAPARPELAQRAAGYLGRAGLRAFGRNDIPATTGLLQRARALLPPGDAERMRLGAALGSALGEAGRFDEALQVLDQAIEEARAAGDRAAEGEALIEQLFVRSDEAEAPAEADAVLVELIPLYEELGDDRALARAWRLQGFMAMMRGRDGEMGAAMERALDHARRAGDQREEALALFWIPQNMAWGPAPAEEGIVRCERLLAAAAGSASAEAGVMNGLSMLYAMAGRADEAWTALRDSAEMYRELGLEVLWGVAMMHGGPVGLYLDDLAAAERDLVAAIEIFERLGERGYRSTAEVWRAQALIGLGRHDEAEAATRLSEELAAPDDMPSQVGWRRERARVLAIRGELDDAERLAREAIALARATDSLIDMGGCALALAEVLRLAGRRAEAADAAADAADAWGRKGIVGYTKRARRFLDELQVPA
jgi:tetratricopeptide (TPR) repeat protein